MKFGHAFKACLKSEGFPADWVDSAISYSQLKKCINRLTDELAQVGLDPQTLGKLLKQVEHYNAATTASSSSNSGDDSSNNDQDDDNYDRPFEYILAGDPPARGASATGGRKPFRPKLLFHVHEVTGELLSAKLDEPTKRKLQMLAVETGISNLRVFEESDTDDQSTGSTDSTDPDTSNSPAAVNAPPATARPAYRTVEIPLTSDTEFFTKLTSELSGLEKLQEREEKRMHGHIEELGSQIARLTDPDRRSNRKLLSVWRQIFQLYVEEDIFFGTTEKDHKAHSAEKATQRLAEFSNKIAQAGLVEKFKKPENLQALNAFMHINREILQGLRFGEINHTAMLKILKKFDKQTALGVKTAFPRQIEYPEFSEHLAKAVCAEVNTQILSHVPQLDDYSCPMCFEIEWRPVKLNCGHVFCIRCLIVMQNNKQHKCPLCREVTVVNANSENLDVELAHFLKKWFPDEVRSKQKYNEIMAGVDQYGEVYAETKCSVM